MKKEKAKKMLYVLLIKNEAMGFGVSVDIYTNKAAAYHDAAEYNKHSQKTACEVREVER